MFLCKLIQRPVKPLTQNKLKELMAVIISPIGDGFKVCLQTRITDNQGVCVQTRLRPLD